MPASVEMLNRWGDNFLSFAWPMLWQSSLLIAIVFAFDFLTAKKIRASIRYALWMVVLVKLILPPALALPTSATWWLWRPSPVMEAPIAQNYTVTVDETDPPANFIPQTIPIALPPPKLNDTAWMMLVSVAVGAGLLLWLAFRWLRIARKVHHVTTSVNFAEILEATRQLARLRRPMRLRLIDSTLSPAVYGLFRPVILLPLVLTEKLSRRQLRAVLLHEAIHLRRGDVWVNCAQTFLQIAYWWHPLLWFANARIRRVREEAVDDAVMVALNTDADAYAPTLLEVAKLAFRRPLASLGLVGIMESRSALRQRIERLVDFRPPHKAGLTLLSLFAIFVFSAVALPMGQGPATSGNSFAADSNSDEQTLTMKVDPQVFIRNLKEMSRMTLEKDPNETLLDLMDSEGVDCASTHNIAFHTDTGEITTQNTPEQLEIFRRVIEQLNRADGKCELPLPSANRKKVLIKARFFWMTSDDLKELTMDATHRRNQSGSSPCWTADTAQFNQIEQQIKKLRLEPFSQPRMETAHGITCEMHIGTRTNWTELDCVPYVSDHDIELAFKAASASVVVQDTLTKTNLCEVYGKETVDDNGGIIVSTEDANNPQTNLVVMLNVKNVEEVPAAKNTTTSPNREKLGKLEREGHQFYDSGHFAEAEQDFTSALALEPTNPATSYWLFMATMRNQITNIHLDQFGPYNKAPLRQVVQDLNQKATNAGAVFNIYFSAIQYVDRSNAPAANTVVTLPVMKNISLAAAFELIVQGASQPTVYFVENVGGVTFSTGPDRYFEMRTFKVSTNVFMANLQKATGLHTFVSSSLVQLFSEAGLDLSPPKSLYFNGGHNVIFVYATRQDLDVIEHIVVELNDPRFQKSWLKTQDVANGPDRQAIYKKINSTHLGPVSYHNLPLSEVMDDLTQQSRKYDPDKQGIRFVFSPLSPAPTIDPATGLPLKTSETDPATIKINLSLNNVGLADLLNAICLVSDHPLKYSVQDYGVVFSEKTDADQYEMHTFKVDPNTVYSNLQKALSSVHEKDIERARAHPGPMAAASLDGSMNGLYAAPPLPAINDDSHYYVATSNPSQNISALAKQLFSALNINVDPPKTVFFNDRLGVLFVFATPQDLKIIEHIVEELNDPRFKASWLKLSKTSVSQSSAPANLNNVIGDPLTAKLPPNQPVSSYVDPTNLIQRTFPADYNGFIAAVRQKTGMEESIEGFKQLLIEAGVDLSPPKTVYRDNHGLFVYARKKDMATIQKVVDDLHCPARMVHIKARFFEVPITFFTKASAPSLAFSLTNGDIFTATEAKEFLHEIQSLKGVQELAEPEVTTISARHTEMRATVIQPVVTNFVLQTDSNNISSLIPQTTQIETGPVFDVIPMIPPGDQKVVLTVTVSLLEFLGYADTKNASPHYVTNSAGEKISIPVVLPQFQIKQTPLDATFILNDGQTVVLFPQPTDGVAFPLDDEKYRELVNGHSQQAEKKSENRSLIVLFTATLIDPAGNRLHSDDQIPIAKNTDYFDPVTP